jgi:hypothetical protein
MAKFKKLIENKLLQEKQILLNHGADYNQAVFLAGGAGSGKGFASKNFMEGQKFRRFDVDRWKEDYIEYFTGRYPELEDLNLQNPEDVSKLHYFVKDRGIHNRFINNVLLDSEPNRRPNVMFDVTLKEADKLHNYVPLLNNIGYDPVDIHLVWVLADYTVAVERNQNRERIVPHDILVKTHEGAAQTVSQLAMKGLPRGMDGDVHAILNNEEHTVFFKDDDDEIIEPEGSPVDLPGPLQKSDEDGTSTVIKDFKYLTLKEAGNPFREPIEIKETLAQWIKRNAPKTVKTWKAMSTLEQ